MSRRAPQGGSYEQALYSVVLLVPRLRRPKRTRTGEGSCSTSSPASGSWTARASMRISASLVRGLPR